MDLEPSQVSKELATAPAGLAKWPRKNQHTNLLPDFPYSMRFAKCKIMLDLGKTYNEIQAATGLCHESIRRVSKGEKEIEQGLQSALRKSEGNKITLLAHDVMDSIDGSVIEKASLLQRVVAVGTLIDKRELLEGRPTSRNETVDTSGATEAEIMELQAKLNAWEDGAVVNTSTLPTENESVEGQ